MSSRTPSVRNTVTSGVVEDVGEEASSKVETESLVGSEDDEVEVSNAMFGLRQLRMQRERTEMYARELVGDADGFEDVQSSDSSVREAGVQQRVDALYAELHEVGDRLSRISSMQMLNVFRRGCTSRAGPRRVPEMRQKVFGLRGTESVTELETANGLYDRLLRGKVVAQLVARTGIGKTTVFAAKIAQKCQARVLLLQPDTQLAGMASDRLKQVSPVLDRWIRVRSAMVTVMTYADFVGHFYNSNGDRMMSCVDVLVMDEAGLPLTEVYVAKSILATINTGDTSVLVMSATLDGDDVQAQNNAPLFKPFSSSLMDAGRKGVLFEEKRVQDQTLLLLATDEDVQEMKELVVSQGFEARVLDSASRVGDYKEAYRWLEGPSMTCRYLVAVERYGTGYNFPVSQVYSCASRKVFETTADDRLKAVEVGLSSAEIMQHAGRVGRGLAKTAQAWVSTRYEKAEFKDFLPTQRLRAWLMLRACGIQPFKQLAPEERLFPYSVTPAVAVHVLAVNLPTELAIRYFNSDGCLPFAYAKALQSFSQVQHCFDTSESLPVGYDTWEDVEVGGFSFFEQPSSRFATVKVPFLTGDEYLDAVIQTVSAIAQGKLNLQPFLPNVSDSEQSDEGPDVVVGKKRGLPRRVVESKRAASPSPDQQKIGWSFNVPVNRQLPEVAGSHMGFVADDGYAVAFRDALERVIAEPAAVVRRELDSDGVPRAKIMSSPKVSSEGSPVDVTADDGTVVVTVRATVYAKLSMGSVLETDEFVSLLRSVRHNVKGFVGSDVFKNWSNVWLSVYKSMAMLDTLRRVQRYGRTATLVELFTEMYKLYAASVQKVVESSNVKARLWSRILSGRSAQSQIDRDIFRGNVEILQSKEFFERVALIRDLSAACLTAFESCGIFSPKGTTMVQTPLPITRLVESSTGFNELTRVVRGYGFKRLLNSSYRTPVEDGGGSGSRKKFGASSSESRRGSK